MYVQYLKSLKFLNTLIHKTEQFNLMFFVLMMLTLRNNIRKLYVVNAVPINSISIVLTPLNFAFILLLFFTYICDLSNMKLINIKKPKE